MYTTYKQNGTEVTVYITTKSGVLAESGSLTLGMLTVAENAFAVTGAKDMKLLSSGDGETIYDAVTDTGSDSSGSTGCGGSNMGGSNSGSSGNCSSSGSTGVEQIPAPIRPFRRPLTMCPPTLGMHPQSGICPSEA